MGERSQLERSIILGLDMAVQLVQICTFLYFTVTTSRFIRKESGSRPDLLTLATFAFLTLEFLFQFVTAGARIAIEYAQVKAYMLYKIARLLVYFC